MKAHASRVLDVDSEGAEIVASDIGGISVGEDISDLEAVAPSVSALAFGLFARILGR